jgi:kinesin family protein 15
MHDHICSNNTLKGELLEVRVSEKRLLDKIQDLKVDYVKLIGDVLEKVVKQQVSENHELRDHIEDAVVARKLAEEELKERMRITESLEEEILEMSSVLGQMNDSIKNLSVDRDALSIQRDQLQGQVILLKESFEKAVAQAEANEAIAQEAQEVTPLLINVIIKEQLMT